MVNSRTELEDVIDENEVLGFYGFDRGR